MVLGEAVHGGVILGEAVHGGVVLGGGCPRRGGIGEAVHGGVVLGEAVHGGVVLGRLSTEGWYWGRLSTEGWYWREAVHRGVVLGGGCPRRGGIGEAVLRTDRTWNFQSNRIRTEPEKKIR